MKKIFCFVVILFSLILTSCNKISSTEPQISTSIIPLKVGNYWEYKTITYKYDEVDSSLIFLDSSIVKMEVTKKDTLESFTGFKIKNYIFLFVWGAPKIVFANRTDGFYIAQGEISPVPYPPLIEKAIPYPTFIGDTTKFGAYKIQTIKLNEKVIITSGTFVCNVYEVYIDETLVGKFWVAPDIGIIKTWKTLGINIEINNLIACNL